MTLSRWLEDRLVAVMAAALYLGFLALALIPIVGLIGVARWAFAGWIG